MQFSQFCNEENYKTAKLISNFRLNNFAKLQPNLCDEFPKYGKLILYKKFLSSFVVSFCLAVLSKIKEVIRIIVF